MVFNNSTLGMVRAEMMVVGYQPWGTDVKNPDFGALADRRWASTASGSRRPTTSLGDRARFAHPGPALIDFVTDPRALAVPPHTTVEEVKGFALTTGRLSSAGTSPRPGSRPDPTSATSARSCDSSVLGDVSAARGAHDWAVSPQTSPFPPIADYAFLSDCHTGALVAPDGSVDWLCVPGFRLPQRLREPARPGCRLVPVRPVRHQRPHRPHLRPGHERLDDDVARARRAGWWFTMPW